MTSAMTAASNRSRSNGSAMASAPKKRRARVRSAAPSNSELGLLRIDALCFDWSASLNDQFSEGAGATSYIEPPQANRRREPIEARLSRKSTPGTHAALVGVSVVEAN